MELFGEIGKDIEILTDEKVEKIENELDVWIQEIESATHSLCNNELFNKHGTRKISGKVLRKVIGEDDIDTPIPNLKNYWTVVKKWYEHKIPLNKDDEYVYNLRPVYTFFKISRGDNKGKEVIYQAKEESKNLYILPENINPKTANVTDLIPLNEEQMKHLCLQEEKFGSKIYLKEEYVEDFQIENHDKIFPYELADECIKTYWEKQSLNNDDYIITTYVA